MSSLLALSQSLADTVEQAGSSVVAVNAGTRISPSGIHWRKDIIVTSDESLQRYDEITITLGDGHTLPVTLVGHDSSTDLAVFQLQNAEIPVAKIGDATTIKVGHLVLGLARSSEGDLRAAMGAVSVVSGAWRSMSGGNIDQFIRPDISLYPGFAGGPLVDAAGYVVGMNTSGRRGTALTIPAATVNRVVDQLQAKGHISRGYLGVGMQPVRLPNNLKTALNLSAATGVIVVNVEPSGPADKAGVLLGDVLITFDNTSVSDTGDVLALLNSSDRIGKTVPVQVVRGGALVELVIVIGERPVDTNS
ncbi:S1C family serine protease [Dendronalium sp. ChiSLP03b]|uniref:S1C family serine protease n=1 Tax=Dendronalium sp. ChiSLP03b TaxID=3075381 RepID=UPI002AD48E4B|nr:trypsin-like peptidase domain-containing protein [Dendronalium sp. ChiSLP03b]MDZ8207240.1 PDZ domain-containing protein [Dendronalium sp. ChiSLP03b]